MIQVTCACGATMQVQDENAGKQCKCPKCGVVCQIPAEAPVSATPVEAVPAAAPAAPAPAAEPPAAAPVAGKRPGGLTALAVINFVFGGLGILFSLGGLACAGAVSSTGNAFDELARAARQTAREAAQRAGDTGALSRLDAMTDTTVGASLGMMYYLVTLLVLVLGAFLIVAGIGYLKQSKKTGYVFGNIYGIVGIILVVIQMATLSAGFGVMMILGLAYPIVTLALLNTVFKESFPNP